MTKYHQISQQSTDTGNDESTSAFLDETLDSSTSANFNLNEFFMNFALEKYCDIATNLKRTNRTFVQNNFSISSDSQQPVPIFQVKKMLFSLQSIVKT